MDEAGRGLKPPCTGAGVAFVSGGLVNPLMTAAGGTIGNWSELSRMPFSASSSCRSLLGWLESDLSMKLGAEDMDGGVRDRPNGGGSVGRERGWSRTTRHYN